MLSLNVHSLKKQLIILIPDNFDTLYRQLVARLILLIYDICVKRCYSCQIIFCILTASHCVCFWIHFVIIKKHTNTPIEQDKFTARGNGWLRFLETADSQQWFPNSWLECSENSCYKVITLRLEQQLITMFRK